MTLENIQNVVVKSSNNTDSAGVNVAPYASVNNLSVTTNGTNNDVVIGGNGVNGAPAQALSLTHNASVGGNATVLGGTNVSVTTNGLNGNVKVGLTAAGSVPLSANVASGAIAVTDTDTGNGAINIVGGSSVTVTTTGSSHNGAIDIGNTVNNTGNSIAGGLANTAGAIKVTAAGKEAITAFGGSTVDITSAGGAIQVGDNTANASVANQMATGVITVTDTAKVAYDGLNIANNVQHNNVEANVAVYGGTDVNVTTNAGRVTIGNNTITKTLPTGNITVVDTANDGQNAAIANAGVTVFGGVNVNVTAADANVTIGGKAGYNPTGTVTVTESKANTQQDLASAAGNHAITIDGGNGVTVSAQGQSVTVGANQGTAGAQVVTQNAVLTGAGLAAGAGAVEVDGGTTVNITTTGGAVTVGKVIGATNAVPTGAVTIANNYGGGNNGNDAIAVLGGSTVSITDNNANKGAITVGQAAALDAIGSGLKNAALEATGNVTIVNAQTNNGTTTYGTGAVNVYTNGGDTVSVTGGATANIIDVQSTLANGGANAGKAVGASHLATVVLSGQQTGGAIAVKSDALANLSVLNNKVANNAITVTNNTAAHALTVTQGGNNNTLNADGTVKVNAASTVTDNIATSFTVTDNGQASSATLTLTGAKATSVTATNAAAAKLDLSNDALLTTITAKNAGALNLGDVKGLAKLMTVDATASTGAVTVVINPGVTSFNGVGGTGVQTVTLSQNSLLQADGKTYSNVLAGSNTGNTLVANYAANLANDVALGNNSHIKGFSVLGLGTAASSATSGAAYVAAQTARTQVDTVTIGGAGTAAQNETYSVTIGATTATYTVNALAGESANQVAQGLAGAILANLGQVVGVSVNNNVITLTAVTAGTGFTATTSTSVGATLTNSDATVTTNLAAVAGDAFYDATGFSTLTVGATTGDVTFKNVGTGVALNDTASQGTNATGGVHNNVINYLLANSAATNDTLTLNVGKDGTAAAGGTAAITSTILTTGIENLSIASLGQVKDATGTKLVNTITIGDTAAKAITITGDQKIALTLKTDAAAALNGAASNVTTIDASKATGDVDVSGVALQNGKAHTITGGSGILTATGGSDGASVDSITTGSGGGSITLGSAGAWVKSNNNTANGAFSTGSSTINLSASTAKSDTLVVADRATATYNGTAGGITGFATGVSNSDQVTYSTAGKTILANVTTAATVSSLAGANAAKAIDFTDALWTKLANLTYTVSNGVITFGATAGHQISDFTSGELVSAAEIIVNVAGGNKVAAFSTGGNSYVVTSDAAQTLLTTGGAGVGATNDNADSIINLRGQATVSGFGTTGAGNTVVVTNVTLVDAGHAWNVANTTDTGTAAAQVIDDKGFGLHTLQLNGTGSATTLTGTQSYTLNNLAESAQVVVNGGVGGSHIGDLKVNQQGTSGNESLTVSMGGTAATVIDSLTVNGDALVVLNGAGNSAAVTSLADSANALTTLKLTGAVALEVGKIAASALTTIDGSTATGAVTLGDVAAIANDGLTVKGGTAAVQIGAWTGNQGTGSLGLSGNNDVVTIGTAAANNNNANKVYASGSNLTLTIDGTGANVITANGAGAKITVGDAANGVGANDIVATGAGDTITFVGTQTTTTQAVAKVGSNATINFATAYGAGASEKITITGDVTGATSSGSYAFTTLNNVSAAVGDQQLVFSNATNEVLKGAVNVASAGSLAQALDLAIAQAAISNAPNPNGGNHAAGANDYAMLDANTGVLTWFQYGGDTYVVEAVNASGAAAANATLDANDVVVKITGLVDLTAAFNNGLGAYTLSL